MKIWKILYTLIKLFLLVYFLFMNVLLVYIKYLFSTKIKIIVNLIIDKFVGKLNSHFLEMYL